MANIIPMVSSTPPPMDDAPSFDEWEEEVHNSDTSTTSTSDSPSADGRISYGQTAEFVTPKTIDARDTKSLKPSGQQSCHDATEKNEQEAEEYDDFSDFSQFEVVNGTCVKNSSNSSNFDENPPVSHLPLTNLIQGNSELDDDNERGHTSTHICDNRTSDNNNFLSSQHKTNSLQESLTDSGLYSNDVSPKSDIPKSEDNTKYGSDNTNSNSNSDIEDTFGDFQDNSDLNSAASEPIQCVSNDAILADSSTLVSEEAISSNVSNESDIVGGENMQSSDIIDSNTDTFQVDTESIASRMTGSDVVTGIDLTDEEGSIDSSGHNMRASCDPAENDSSQQNSMANDCSIKNQINVDNDVKHSRTDETDNISVDDVVEEHVDSKCSKDTDEDTFEFTDSAEFSDNVPPADTHYSDDGLVVDCPEEEKGNDFESNDNIPGLGNELVFRSPDLKMGSQESDAEDATTFAAFESKISTDDANWAAFKTNSTDVDAAQNDDDDDDFGEFDSHTHVDGKVADDDDDFGEFDSHTHVDGKVADNDDDFGEFDSHTRVDGKVADDDDDFGEFDSHTRVDGKVADDDDDFGDFGTFEENINMEPADGGGWANFESPSQMSTDNKATQLGDASTSSTSETEKTIPFSNPDILLMLSGCFTDDIGFSQSAPYLLEKAILEDIHNKMQPARNKAHQKNGKSSSPVTFWTSLHNMERTEAVSFQWGDCCLNKKLYQTLQIDPRNILKNRRKTNVPIFAADLGLLQPSLAPTRGRTGSDSENALVDTSKAETLPPAGQDLPPVQFDWSTSGLTNPLESSAKSLDLDFLTVQEQENTNNKAAFKQDQSTLSKPMQPLEDILASMKFNSTIRAPTKDEDATVHTPEVSAIIKSLPELSFMTAKVLMFPIRQMDM